MYYGEKISFWNRGGISIIWIAQVAYVIGWLALKNGKILSNQSQASPVPNCSAGDSEFEPIATEQGGDYSQFRRLDLPKPNNLLQIKLLEKKGLANYTFYNLLNKITNHYYLSFINHYSLLVRRKSQFVC